MIEFNDKDLIAFKTSLKSGYGLTKACQFIFFDIQEISEHIRENKSFHALCEDCVKVHLRGLLAMGQQHLVDLDFDKFARQNAFMTRFIGRLTLWGEFSIKDELDTKKFLKAVYLYKYPEEVATACSMSLPEMYDYIITDEVLFTFLSKKHWIS